MNKKAFVPVVSLVLIMAIVGLLAVPLGVACARGLLLP